MRKFLLTAGLIVLVGVGLLSAQSINPRSDIFRFINGIRLASQTFTALSGSSDAITLGNASATSVTLTTDGGSLSVDGAATLDANGYRVTMPATQTIAAGDTITANACGGLKRVTAAGAVTTNTTNTFTAPAAGNAGCFLLVCNVGANAITLDNNANFKSIGGVDIVLGADDCTGVASTGASGVWYSTGSLVAN